MDTGNQLPFNGHERNSNDLSFNDLSPSSGYASEDPFSQPSASASSPALSSPDIQSYSAQPFPRLPLQSSSQENHLEQEIGVPPEDEDMEPLELDFVGLVLSRSKLERKSMRSFSSGHLSAPCSDTASIGISSLVVSSTLRRLSEGSLSNEHDNLEPFRNIEITDMLNHAITKWKDVRRRDKILMRTIMECLMDERFYKFIHWIPQTIKRETEENASFQFTVELSGLYALCFIRNRGYMYDRADRNNETNDGRTMSRMIRNYYPQCKKYRDSKYGSTIEKGTARKCYRFLPKGLTLCFRTENMDDIRKKIERVCNKYPAEDALVTLRM